MITRDREKYILRNAYVPEHLVGLMTHLSGGEPFLIDDFFCCVRKDWVVLVGYPLQGDFRIERIEDIIGVIKKRFRPRNLSLIAPNLPQSVSSICEERERDSYYTLEAQTVQAPGSVRRNLKKAIQALSVERAHCMGKKHHALVEEFVARANPSGAVRELLAKMPDYVANSDHSAVLNAWDARENLAAFYIIDLTAGDFCSYIIGCYSRKNYVPGASDLLLWETIQMSRHREKKYVHLGLGVNTGIRRFKEKWGARASMTYEKGQIAFRKPTILDTVFSIRNPKK